MTALILGLLIFLGVHSVRIFADDWRAARIAAMGENAWKGAYTLLSLLGFALIVWGYGQARLIPTALWPTPVWTRHVAALFTLPAFVLLVAAYVPGNRIKVRIGHPMVAGVKLWAFAHLLANGTTADLALFGSFLVWAALSFRAARQRDRVAQVVRTPGPVLRDILTLAIGAIAWAAFAFKFHVMLIGVRPFG
jgi:uncharacterized membrane protein